MHFREVLTKLWRRGAFLSLAPISSLYLYATAQPIKDGATEPVASAPARRFASVRTAKQYVDAIENGLDYLRISMRDIRDAYDGDVSAEERRERAIYAERGLLLYANSIRNASDAPASCWKAQNAITRLSAEMVAQNERVLESLERGDLVRNPSVMMENIRLVREIGVALAPAVKEAKKR